MNILFATSEAVPFCKTGGLADVCGSLPRELAALGHRSVIVLPAYRQVFEAGLPIEPTGIRFTVPIGQKQVEGQFLRSELPASAGSGSFGSDSAVSVYFVKQDEYYDRRQLYCENGEDYQDNCERFTFYCQAVLKAVTLLDLETELIHCHDWCTGLIPAYLRTVHGDQPPFDQIATVMTIHNLAHQGNFWHWDMVLTGVDWKYFNWRQMEFFGNLSLMKTGIVFADTISTVSPTYAREILRAPLGCGMEGALQHRSKDLEGIINGVDYHEWTPETDPVLEDADYGGQRYGIHNFKEGKASCKAALQRMLGLPVRPEAPLLAVVGRLADQKGFDLIVRVMRGWAGLGMPEEGRPEKGLPGEGRPEEAFSSTGQAPLGLANGQGDWRQKVQWVILGTGEPKYHHVLSQLAAENADRMAVRLEFSNVLAHRIEAGADLFLMPSQYEPCGLNQLYSLKYGTVPVVRRTGGLADTVIDTTPETIANGTATGFAFTHYTALELAGALDRACQAYGDQGLWHTLVETGMQQDWSWRHSAAEYVGLYEHTLEQAREPRAESREQNAQASGSRRR